MQIKPAIIPRRDTMNNTNGDNSALSVSLKVTLHMKSDNRSSVRNEEAEFEREVPNLPPPQAKLWWIQPPDPTMTMKHLA